MKEGDPLAAAIRAVDRQVARMANSPDGITMRDRRELSRLIEAERRLRQTAEIEKG